MGKIIKYVVKSEKKLFNILKEDLEFSSRIIRKLKKDKKVVVNNIPLSFNARLRVGDTIVVTLPDEVNIFNPEDMPIDVVYEDDHYIVLNKQPYIVVHPTKGHPFNTIANGVAFYMESQGDSYKIRFGNRLDRDTSGALIICKTGLGQKIVSDQMQAQTIVKEYDAIVHGIVLEDEGTIDEPIGLASEDTVHRIVRNDGSPSLTHYKVMKRMGDKTWLRIHLKTGRTHQIRVHLKHLGHIIIGDELYGSNHDLIGRQALHACHLGFNVIGGEAVDLWVEMPEDMKKIVE